MNISFQQATKVVPISGRKGVSMETVIDKSESKGAVCKIAR